MKRPSLYMLPLRHSQALICLWLASTTYALQAQQPYVIKTGTNEVALTFRAEDSAGRAINDLQLSDLKLLDNGHAPQRVTLFVHHRQLPVHIAVVLDISPSMAGGRNPREVAKRLAETAIHDARDQALVMFFDFEPLLEQDWTSDPKLLDAAAAKVGGKSRSRLGGTAIWDSLYQICRDHVPAQTAGDEAFSSAIVLFTDGIDNRSHALPDDVVKECQTNQTAIYPFVETGKEHFDSGQKALRSMAEMTGGRVFYEQNSADLRTSILQLDNDLLDRYTLVYRPPNLQPDGKFHTIKLTAPRREATFLVRSGYYAEK
jgi:Ca-activated chloride channel family protein